MDKEFISILRCPVTGEDLHPGQDGIIQTADGKRRYHIRDSIYDFLGETQTGESSLRAEKETVKNFYEKYGWEKTDEGIYQDSVAFAALGDTARQYTRQCNTRARIHFKRGGRFFLDAGSGAIPWAEYLQYHDKFEVPIFVDISRASLVEAKRKIGEKGRYVLADLTQLPFRDGTIDTAISNHVIYHIPSDEQSTAFTELARVLSPGGKAVVVYIWAYSPLEWRLSRIFDLFRGGEVVVARSGSTVATETRPELYFHAHSLEWFQSQPWPFKYQILSFRLIGNPTMKRYFQDTFLWRFVVRGLLLFQKILPGFCGRYGAYPLIVLFPSGNSRE